MSNITNDNVGPAGTVAAAADVNTKFAAVATATATINESNVRSEAIDRHTLQANGGTLVHSSYVANNGAASTTEYNGLTGTASTYLSHGGGLEIDLTGLAGGGLSVLAGDLVRIHFAVHLRKHSNDNFVPNLDGLTGAANVDTCGLCLIVFPVWDIGSGFVVLPNRSDLTASVSAGSGISIDPAIAPAAYKTDGFAFYPLTGQDDGVDCNVFKTMHGSAVHLATSPFLLEKIRLYLRAPLNYQSDSTGARKELGVKDFTAAPWNSFITLPWNFTMERGHMALTVLRGGNV